MIRRPVLAAAVLSAALLPLAALKPAVAAKEKITFTRQLVSPKSVKVGASVTARFRANLIGGATANSTAQLTAGTATATMTLSGKDYTATFNAPPVNSTGNKPVTVPVTAVLQTSLGQKTIKLGSLKVTPAPIDTNGPPPPPPI